MNNPEQGGNIKPLKTLDEALAKLRNNPKVIAGFAKRNEELKKHGIDTAPTNPKPKKILRTTPNILKHPINHFSEIDQPELIQTNDGWVRKEE